jgi:hypothetical protein
MAQFNAPFSTASGRTHGPSLVSGIPSVIQYAKAMLEAFPSTYAMAVNVALEDHVSTARKELEHDTEYSDLSEYYDVVGEVGDDGIELEFGFFKVPDNLKGLVSRMEFGDANHPPRAFVRRTVYKGLEDIVKDISTTVNVTFGTEVDYA